MQAVIDLAFFLAKNERHECTAARIFLESSSSRGTTLTDFFQTADEFLRMSIDPSSGVLDQV